MATFEWIGLLIEVAGHAFMIVAYAAGLVDTDTFVVFMLVPMGFGIALSLSAVLLDKMSFHIDEKPGQFLILLAMSILKNIGYRQLNSARCLWELPRWLSGSKASWQRST